MSLGLAPVNPACNTTNVSAIVVLVLLTAVVVPLTVKLPPITASPVVVIEATLVIAPLLILIVPSVSVPPCTVPEAVTAVRPDKVASRFTVKVLPEPAVVILVPPAMSSVSLSKSMLSAESSSPLKSKSEAVNCASTYALTDCCVGIKLALFEAILSSSTNAVTVILPSLNDPYCTVPLAVIFVAPVTAPLLTLKAPSVKVVALTLVKPLTELASPTVIVLLLTVVVVSLDVPAKFNVSVPTLTTSSDPLSAPTVKSELIDAVPAAVKRPCA